jgi:Polysaccharide deacetylase
VKSWLPAVPTRAWVLLVALLLLAGVGWLYKDSLKTEPSIVLLLPDEAALALPVTQAWIDAAREEGLAVKPMTDDTFLRYGGDRQRIAGVILPDTVHPQASEMLVNQLHRYVGAGGHLFITFDAALLDSQNGLYAAEQSRLSGLAGVRYAMYDALKDRTISRGVLLGSRDGERVLGLQPGKMDFKTSSRLPLGELTTYGYAHLQHGYFRTEPASGAVPLMVSAEGDLVVSTHRYGQGSVLFANLALGYLKTRTDAYLLHRLLGHFSTAMLKQPRLSPVPEGTGGLVLNLHVDSNAAQAPLKALESSGWFKQGPFSVHVTAGPDAEREGDGLGIGVKDNPEMKAFLQRLIAGGHEVGNHGGWNHNLFGKQANDDNRERFEPLLAQNQSSVGGAIGVLPRSYSAPMGNQPRWATEWLRREGFKAYYFTGDNGLGPTRSYEQGLRPQASALWAFPVSSHHRVATFEELAAAEPPVVAEEMAAYLADLTRFVADQHIARLFYFHPPAATQHLPSIEVLMAETRRLAELGRFRWYTMEQLADFMSRRELAQWQPTPGEGSGGGFSASSSASLEQLSWVVPQAGKIQFRVVSGEATVRKEGADWIVTAGKGHALRVQWQ